MAHLSAPPPPLPTSAGDAGSLLVWDLPTRLFHWLLVALVAGLWLTGEVGTPTIVLPWPGGRPLIVDSMTQHAWMGQALLGLLLFRLAWGVVGSTTARFASFVRGPAAVIAYLKAVLRGETPLFLGHNPAGALMILALIALLVAQAVSGLFANDDSFYDAPLAKLIGKAASDQATGVHKLLINLLLALIAVHVAAVAYYRLRGENLIRAMISGRKHGHELPPGTPAPRIGPLWLAALLAAAALTAVPWLVARV